ncbi:MAG: permease [Candidatus Marinimicrobia bacterium]|nr:permease [Candidatus Neomarinimicrobiota bacterium]
MIENFILELWILTKEMSPYLLLGFLIAGILSVVISPAAVERNLGGNGLFPIVKASLFGIPLPLCSCGVIPVATSLYKHGANRSATTSFLISTPQTGVDSILVTYSLLGPIFAIFRPIAALFAGIVGGLAVEISDHGSESKIKSTEITEQNDKSIFRRIYEYGFIALPQDIGKTLILGIVVAAIISMVVPDDFFASYFGNGFVGLIIMMFAGIPIYVCATASVPIALALMIKGLSPGAAFVFLMTGPATNAATISTVWKILGKKTAFIYLGAVSGCSLVAGFFINLFSSEIGSHIHNHDHWMMPVWFQITSSVLLLGILANSLLRLYFPSMFISGDSIEATQADLVLSVGGMTCNHCVNSVTTAISEVSNVAEVDVDLASGNTKIKCNDINIDEVVEAITASGYSAELVK